MQKMIILCLAGILMQPCFGQIERLKIQEKFQGLQNWEAPAQFSSIAFQLQTFSWQVRAAVGYELLKTEKFVLYPMLEYHRNNSIAGEQHNFQAGGQFYLYLLNTPEKFKLTAIGKMNYRRDMAIKINALQAHFLLAPSLTKAASEGYDWKVVRFSYQPYVGLEYENRLDALESQLVGEILRLYGRLQLRVMLLPEKLNERIMLSGDVTYRLDLSDTSGEQDSNHLYINSSLTYEFIPQTTGNSPFSLQLALDYINGQDPIRGFLQQQMWLLGLRLKL